MLIEDSASIPNTRNLLSQTPKNYNPNNYFLKELQDKVNADWRFIPNRADIEIETSFGSNEFDVEEVVLTSVKSEKGEAISEDWWNVIFKDINCHKKIGQRYRFANNFDINAEDKEKNVYIALNQAKQKVTASQVICRCNGTIASIYRDNNGNNIVHYEPVIQKTKINNAGFAFDDVAIDPKGQLVIIAQYNKYTQQYYTNERFVIGTDNVYKITNILKTDSRTTYNPEDIGYITMYMEVDQKSKKDNFMTRLAFNGAEDTPVEPVIEGEYTLKIVDPTSIPDNLGSTFTFKPALFLNGVEQNTYTVEIVCNLEGVHASKASVSDFVEISSSGKYFTLTRKKQDLTMKLNVTCNCTVNDRTISYSFIMRLVDKFG